MSYFLGLGLFVRSAIPASLRNIPTTGQEVARFLSFTILLGISINHLLMLLVHNLRVSFIIGAFFSLVGFLYAIFIVRNFFGRYFRLGRNISVAVVATVFIFIVIIMNTRLGWDSQYIWFFHGKMIYFNNGLYQDAGWSHPAYQFSHVDYPKLIAILAAQFACLTGTWNDYLPRLSLLILLVPALLGVMSFSGKSKISFVYLYLMVFFSLNEYTTNGYMDAYLAIYVSLSLLFLWRWVRNEVLDDFLSAFAYITIIPLMKNEGMLYLVSILLNVLMSYLVLKNKRHLLLSVFRASAFRYMSFILFLNIILWSWIKYSWNLKNDLNLGFASIKLIIGRIGDGSIFYVLRMMVTNVNIGISISLLLFAVLMSVRSRVFAFKDILFTITVTSIYFAGIFLIYMSTPHDLFWHLSSSTYRTMMPVNMSIITATYIVLTTLDTSVDQLHHNDFVN